MARFVDLEEDDGDSAPLQGQDVQRHLQELHINGHNGVDPRDQTSEDERHPTFYSAVTEAFQCYPVVIAIVSGIDLNTLDSLSRVCRKVHDGLVQYRKTLLASTLRCVNEAAPVNPEETLRYRARAGNWYYMEDGRSYNGKSGDCARDMVGECRRCKEVICRNCAIKPPAPTVLRERHRRLCKPCTRAPIATLLKPPQEPHLDVHADVVNREVCKCDSEGVWLCQPCRRSIRGADHEYYRIWRWRNHYGEVLGGLGTGIGDGDRGVICGREERCCAAKEIEQETDCDAYDAKDVNNAMPWDQPSPPSTTGTPPLFTGGLGMASPFLHHGVAAAASASSTSLDVPTPDSDFFRFEQHRTSTPQLGPGYERHEIEGIGGRVKRKLVRMVRIGHCVAEYEDERTSGSKILGREVRGEVRSWCGWCWRVIPGAKDWAGLPPSPEVQRAQPVVKA